MAVIQIKRIYEQAEVTDCYRILVYRHCPRGLKLDILPADLWPKDIAPTQLLCHRFNHHPAKWEVFCASNMAELSKSAVVADLVDCFKRHTAITLLFSANDKHYNYVQVWQQF
jgi:uncharacterized protein YeaO (DUF488 family)